MIKPDLAFTPFKASQINTKFLSKGKSTMHSWVLMRTKSSEGGSLFNQNTRRQTHTQFYVETIYSLK